MASRLPTAYERMIPALGTFVITVLVIACLYWARPVLIPFALAILFTFLLTPVVLWLQRKGLPRTYAVITVVLIASLFLAGIGWLFVSQVVHLANQLPKYETNVTERIESLREQGRGGLLSKVTGFVDRIVEAATEPADPNRAVPRTPRVEVVSPGWDFGPYLTSLGPILEPIATAGLVIVLVIFMLLQREDGRDRLITLLGQRRLITTTRALDDAAQRIGRYLLAQFCLNAGFGIVMGGGLLLIGVPHALLWGLLAAFLRYIPMLGPWVAAIFPLAMTLLTSSGWLQPLLVVALFVAFELISNLVVEPLVYGQSIGVSQAALIVSIAFWTWLWGPIGLMLAAPLTVCLVILGKYVPQLKFFDIVLGDEPTLSPDASFYQRLVARDEDEASEIAREQLDASSLVQVLDRLFVPAIVYAKRDLAADRLADGDADFIIEAIQTIAEEELFDEIEKIKRAAAEQAAQDEGGRRLEILACAADERGDEVALRMFDQLLDLRWCDTEILSTKSLVSEVVQRVENDRPAAVLIAALPPGGLAKTRLLCKRLRSRFPDLQIMIGRWGIRSNADTIREPLINAGASLVGTSMEESLAQVEQLAQYMRPAPQSNAVPPPHTSRGSPAAIVSP